ncbi:hypothetical protein OJ997_24595 [Solirubrobacter phytolaccae]|uniref:Uncharacterized protein n=1 Tax=Solirubrobacter phytolaccae TaxID=1404360 RepID=A0A9X3NCH4_9ACTN|nr:hypothetical protein [Solirubrobacter phytolaccae]MDA0183511.1 hypothetical protein [Solirubrobacter phytolaccae]
MNRRLKISVRDHGRKSHAFVGALAAAGHTFQPDGEVDILLLDLDPPYLLHKRLLDTYSEMGAKIILYPHGGGGPQLSYEGLWAPDARVFANLVTGPGHAEYLRRIDYPAQVHSIGWTYCDQLPFRTCEDVRNVVFAPWHPNGDGSMTDVQRDWNTKAFEQLLASPFKITVRHIGTLEQNGLWKAEGVTYVNGRTSAQNTEMDRADAVVAADGTYPTIAVARGVPTVVYGQGVMAIGFPGETPKLMPDRPELYWDYAQYPYDLANGDLETLVRTAARTEATAWRRRYVGEDFDPLKFVRLVERIMSEDPDAPVHIDETRSHTTLALADELVENPALLKAYCNTYGPEDDASLLLWAPGVPAEELLAMAETAIETSGVDPNRLPDMLLAPLAGSPKVDAALAERADTLLSEWPAAGRIGALPRFASALAAR